MNEKYQSDHRRLTWDLRAITSVEGVERHFAKKVAINGEAAGYHQPVGRARRGGPAAA